MKGELRQSWLEIANLPRPGWGLCGFCQFSDFEGSSCCDGILYCDHPLPVINGENDDGDHVNNVWGEGGDCWAFRPNITLQEAGIIASIRCDGNQPHKNKDGEYVAITFTQEQREKYGL